jgi:hypothetical protein
MCVIKLPKKNHFFTQKNEIFLSKTLNGGKKGMILIKGGKIHIKILVKIS